ncbi:PQQ-dependent sugar dehydrogenase [Sphingobium phenoxybenzoativorans]|uniref:PQQ-dependent sugar dehydrogenase n=1 Tax=Sphingobium phenoxybenzoativorans TaxID=1592790 RepID=A0A975K904_9SPHN|nr:PQQ-dependent sugar dehydrogenase [Sphingobium phenoxybenzoativorans]QUT07019.1 PQQ-dependent sugar dehydrogenase [Sphingobium phenoxybenzoativorans]
MRKISATALPLILLACSADNATGQNAPAADKPFRTSIIADFDSPWAMTFIPDGRMLVTEKAGEMLLFDPRNGTKIPVSGIPEVDSAGQGALMDVVLSPQFDSNHMVYFSFSEAGEGGKGVALATGRFDQASDGATKLDGVKVIFRGDPKVEGNGHYSGRIAFSPDGRYLFFTNGDRQKFDPAQDPKSTLGKVLRLNLDGTAARGNPLSSKGFNPAIWSYGHRNLLGIAFDGDGRLWEQEMGPQGGDEINLIKPGLNYGWPRASNGSHYDGRDIPDHKAGDGFEAPKVWWNPAISPGGLLYYSGAMFPQWKGSLFLGGLSSEALIRVKINGETASKADQWDMGARIREVEQGPDGALWLLEDGNRGSQGRLLKLTPAE